LACSLSFAIQRSRTSRPVQIYAAPCRRDRLLGFETRFSPALTSRAIGPSGGKRREPSRRAAHFVIIAQQRCRPATSVAVGTRITPRPPQSGRTMARCGLRMMPPFPSPPKSRVGDWRAGLGRDLCSLLPRPFGCEVSQHFDHAYVSSPRHVERSVRISRLYAHLPASPQGLWDLSCWDDFRLQQPPPNPLHAGNLISWLQWFARCYGLSVCSPPCTDLFEERRPQHGDADVVGVSSFLCLAACRMRSSERADEISDSSSDRVHTGHRLASNISAASPTRRRRGSLPVSPRGAAEPPGRTF
jgi:hypothetical protein